MILLCQQSPQASFSLHHHSRCLCKTHPFLLWLSLPVRVCWKSLPAPRHGLWLDPSNAHSPVSRLSPIKMSYKDVLTLSWYLLHTYSVAIVLKLFSHKWETGSFKMATQAHSRKKPSPKPNIHEGSEKMLHEYWLNRIFMTTDLTVSNSRSLISLKALATVSSSNHWGTKSSLDCLVVNLHNASQRATCWS